MAGLLDVAQQRLMGLLNVPTEVQRFATNPQAFLSLLGVNKLPQATGFAAGATGLPPKDILPGGVLNPPNLAYQQGYEQGEPFSYAAMASPLAKPAAKALAPKAYDMLENYMVKTGGMIPLEAWHGTPHNIQGKFDISKVGTGEGNQSYGYGMYFAENPNVAKGYQETLGQKKDIAVFKGNDGFYVKKGLGAEGQNLAGPFSNASEAEKIRKALPENQGNLYKVDIPDEYIPNMLDWDKPFSKQSKSVQDAIKQIEPKIKQINPDLNVEKLNGEGIYRAYQQYRGNNPDFASEGLNELGVKGIRYLDQGSRNPGFTSLTPSQLETRMDILKEDIKSGLGNQELMKDQLRKMQAEMDSYKNMTSNFVVFDPSTVKILEENNIPIEGLLK